MFQKWKITFFMFPCYASRGDLLGDDCTDGSFDIRTRIEVWEGIALPGSDGFQVLQLAVFHDVEWVGKDQALWHLVGVTNIGLPVQPGKVFHLILSWFLYIEGMRRTRLKMEDHILKCSSSLHSISRGDLLWDEGT